MSININQNFDILWWCGMNDYVWNLSFYGYLSIKIYKCVLYGFTGRGRTYADSFLCRTCWDSFNVTDTFDASVLWILSGQCGVYVCVHWRCTDPIDISITIPIWYRRWSSCWRGMSLEHRWTRIEWPNSCINTAFSTAKRRSGRCWAVNAVFVRPWPWFVVIEAQRLCYGALKVKKNFNLWW